MTDATYGRVEILFGSSSDTGPTFPFAPSTANWRSSYWKGRQLPRRLTRYWARQRRKARQHA